MDDLEMLELDLEIVRDSADGILVSDGDTEVWLPKRECIFDDTTHDAQTMQVPRWLAVDRGLV